MTFERLHVDHEGDAHFDKSLYQAKPGEIGREPHRENPIKKSDQDEINRKGLAALREVLKKSKNEKK